MTDLSDRLAELLTDEPPAPYDIDRVVTAGRRAQRRRTAVLATAGTLSAAGLTAAVVIPVLATGGGETTVRVGVQPAPTPTSTATTGKCYAIAAPPKAAKLTLQRLVRSGRVGTDPSVKEMHTKSDGRKMFEVCAPGAAAPQPEGPADATASPPAGPPYHYTEQPTAIADRLGSHLRDRVNTFGLTITYVRDFAQESTTLESGHPSYFDGNVDVREASGYGDIGVQVTHTTTEQVPFDSSCTAAEHCEETTLSDGSVLRTGQVSAGQGMTVLTAEVHCPDGVVVAAQESNYAFGPAAKAGEHGDQPLSLDQLIGLAEDSHFTF